MKSLSIISSIALLVSAVIAQEGSTVPTTTTTTDTYTCDPSKCLIANNCLCASKTAPGGLAASDVPQVKKVNALTRVYSTQFNFFFFFVSLLLSLLMILFKMAYIKLLKKWLISRKPHQ